MLAGLHVAESLLDLDRIKRTNGANWVNSTLPDQVDARFEKSILVSDCLSSCSARMFSHSPLTFLGLVFENFRQVNTDQ